MTSAPGPCYSDAAAPIFPPNNEVNSANWKTGRASRIYPSLDQAREIPAIGRASFFSHAYVEHTKTSHRYFPPEIEIADHHLHHGPSMREGEKAELILHTVR
jgi:hypothetical protein